MNVDDEAALSSNEEKQFDVSNILADYFKDKIRQGIGVGSDDGSSQSEEGNEAAEDKKPKGRHHKQEDACEDGRNVKAEGSKRKKEKKKKKKNKKKKKKKLRSSSSSSSVASSPSMLIEQQRSSKGSAEWKESGRAEASKWNESPLRGTKDRHRRRSRDREKHLERRHASRSRSRSRPRSRSREGRGRRDRRRSRSKDRRKNRSRSSGHFRSPLRSRELSGRGGRSSRDDGDASDVAAAFDKKELLEVARRNVKVMIQTGTLPKGVDVEKLGLDMSREEANSTAESVDKFTEICRKIQETGDDDESAATARVSHPFQVKERPIRMNIPNAVQLPAKSFQEKIKDTAALTAQFPVSSGSTHRKNEVKELDWKPVTKENPKDSTELKESVEKTTKDEHNAGVIVASDTASSSESRGNVQRPTLSVAPTAHQEKHFEESLRNMTIPQVMAKRVEALQRLQRDPADPEAKQLHEATENVIRQWSRSKQQPGQLTNSVDTSVKFLSPAELQEGPQAWVKKDQLQKARAVEGGIGMALLQKMGWKPGTALGKNREGTLEPLLPPIKMDRKGLVAQEESIARDISVSVAIPNRSARANAMLQEVQASSLGGKHPVSALIELCTAHKISAPDFVELPAFGPDHKKTFLYKVIVNGRTYQPLERSPNKKLAKAAAALVALNEMGVVVGIEKAPRMSLLPQTTGTPPPPPPGVSAEEMETPEIFQPLKCTDPSKMASSFFTSFHASGIFEGNSIEACGPNQTKAVAAPQAMMHDPTGLSSFAAGPPHSLWQNYGRTPVSVDQMQYGSVSYPQEGVTMRGVPVLASNGIPLMVPPPTEDATLTVPMDVNGTLQ